MVMGSSARSAHFGQFAHFARQLAQPNISQQDSLAIGAVEFLPLQALVPASIGS
jgi:hypothetical protein